MRCFCTHVATWNRWSCWRSPEGTCLLVVIRQNYMRHFDNSINSVQVPEGWGTHGTNGSAQGFLAAKSIAMLEWLTWFQVMYIEETKEPGGISVARSGHHGTTWDMLRTRLDSVITSNQVGGSPFLSNLWPAHQMSWVTFLSDTSILLIWHYAILWYVHICIYKHIHIYIRIYTPTPTYIYTYTQPTLKTTVQRRCRRSTICHVIQMFHEWTLRSWWIFWAHFLRLMLHHPMLDQPKSSDWSDIFALSENSVPHEPSHDNIINHARHWKIAQLGVVPWFFFEQLVFVPSP